MRAAGKALSLILPAIFAALSATPAPASDYETPPILEAGRLLPPELMKGGHHVVEPQVVNDGYMNHFTIRSDFGTFEATSEAMVAVRVQEVKGLAALKELSQSDVFVDALADSAKKTVKSVKNVVVDPVGTVKGVGEGVGRMFKRMSLKAKKVKGTVQETVSREDGAKESEPGGSGEEKAVETAKSLIGYNSAKRGLARRVQIDPYSNNETLQAELDRLAKAAFAGGFAFDKLAPSVPLQGEIGMVSDLVWSTHPADLEVMNREKLAVMGVGKGSIDAFYGSGLFSPTGKTAMVGLLSQMEGVEDRGAVLDLAAALENRDEALLFLRSARILSGYHTKIEPLKRIVAHRVLPWGVTGDGTTILPAAVDHLVWTEAMAGAIAASEEARAADLSLDRMELWVSGTLSARMKKEIEGRSWRIHEKSEADLGIAR